MFSIIIPLYNKKATVANSVKSALSAVGVEQVILVDDGSTDGSLHQLHDITDSRLKIILQDNAGPGVARNRGLQMCESKYVLFLDADDEVYPDIFTTTHDVFKAYPDSAAVVHAWHFGDDRVFSQDRYAAAGLSPGIFRLPSSIDGVGFKRVVDLCHSGAIVAKTELVRAYGGFFDSWKCTYAEDSYLWIRLLLKNNIFFTLQPKMWFNTGASELGIGRVGRKPSRPIVVDPTPTRNWTPAEYLPALNRLLDLYVLTELAETIDACDRQQLFKLIRDHFSTLVRHPRMAARIVRKFPDIMRSNHE